MSYRSCLLLLISCALVCNINYATSQLFDLNQVHLLDDPPTRASCDQRFKTTTPCFLSYCYAQADCMSTINAYNRINLSSITTASLDGICQSACFSRLMNEVRAAKTANCRSAGGDEVDDSALNDISRNVCSRDSDGVYCINKLQQATNNYPAFLDNNALMTTTNSSTMCMRIRNLGCCIGNLPSIYQSYAIGPLVPLSNTFLEATRRCNTQDSPRCVGVKETKKALDLTLRLNGLSYTKYQALSQDLQLSVQYALRQDLASWLVTRGLSWITYNNIFIISLSGTTSYIQAKIQAFGSSDTLTNQASYTIRDTLTSMKNNNGAGGPTFTSTVAAADVSTTAGSAATLDASTSTAAEVTVGSNGSTDNSNASHHLSSFSSTSSLIMFTLLSYFIFMF